MDVASGDSLAPQAASRRELKLTALLEVAKAMSAQRNLDDLLPLIMTEAARTVEADRCSLFILDRQRNELWSRVAQGAKSEIRVPINQGIAGAVARTGQIINLVDAYDDPRFQRDVDLRTGYRTTSLLCVPMRDTTGDLTGVIQALNSSNKRFDAEDEELLMALGSLAAQAIENTMLTEEISRLFEGFAQASMFAIESRDPTTAGHSSRVAQLTVGLANAVAHVKTGPYGDLEFSADQLQELRYAALLHDFGKIGVREPVLVKAEKLYPHEIAILQNRFELARKDKQLASAMRKMDAVRFRGTQDLPDVEREEELRLASDLKALDDALAFVMDCNHPTVSPAGAFEHLATIGAMAFTDSNERVRPLLTPVEQAALSIRQGSLSAVERLEIESHVTHTFRFLSQIPWTRSLKRVPEIAYAHHERLDGTGYPRQLGTETIPVQTKIMSIADVYDALTATDRPYKRAVPHVRALDIIADEAKLGKLDADLFKVFVEAQVPQKALQSRDKATT